MLGVSCFEGLKASICRLDKAGDGDRPAVDPTTASHLDAPYHYHPPLSRRACIDHERGAAGVVPSARVKLDFRFFPRLLFATERMSKTSSSVIATRFPPLDSSWSIPQRRVPKIRPQDYFNSGCAWSLKPRLSAGAGVRLTGIGGLSWDAHSFNKNLAEIRRNQGRPPDLGRHRLDPHRLLPSLEAAQSGASCRRPVSRVVLSVPSSGARSGAGPVGRHSRWLILRLDAWRVAKARLRSQAV